MVIFSICMDYVAIIELLYDEVRRSNEISDKLSMLAQLSSK